jgi:hypothetical protein
MCLSLRFSNISHFMQFAVDSPNLRHHAVACVFKSEVHLFDSFEHEISYASAYGKKDH